MNRSNWARFFRILFGLATLAALVRQLEVHWELGFALANFFSYYTVLSNLLAGCVLLISAAPISPGDPFLANLRVISVINMALVGIIFSALLRNTNVGSLLPWVNFTLHYLMPCVVVAEWLLLPPRSKLGWRELILALIFPLAYVIYTLVRGAIVGWYPYPFLDPCIAGGAGGVGLYVMAITIVFALVGSALIALANWRGKRGVQR